MLIRLQAQRLDRADPSWWERINTSTLRNEYSHCVLTQAFGGWWSGREYINGVSIDGDRGAFILAMFWKTRWRHQINKRRRKHERSHSSQRAKRRSGYEVDSYVVE